MLLVCSDSERGTDVFNVVEDGLDVFPAFLKPMFSGNTINL
jgi:hypothetical protein